MNLLLINLCNLQYIKVIPNASRLYVYLSMLNNFTKEYFVLKINSYTVLT